MTKPWHPNWSPEDLIDRATDDKGLSGVIKGWRDHLPGGAKTTHSPDRSVSVIVGGDNPVLDAELMAPDPPQALPSINNELSVSVRRVSDALAPQVEELIALSVKSYVADLLSGRKPDLVPDVSVHGTDALGRKQVVLDARNRSWRTFVQGLGTDIFVALGVGAGDMAGVDLFTQHGWQIIGLSLAKTVIVAGASYLTRLKVAPAVEQK